MSFKDFSTQDLETNRTVCIEALVELLKDQPEDWEYDFEVAAKVLHDISSEIGERIKRRKK